MNKAQRKGSNKTASFFRSKLSLHIWWRNQMEAFFALLALCVGNSPVTGEFPTQRSVTWSFDVSFDLRLKKRLSKPSRCRWFETPLRPLWRHCNVAFQYLPSPRTGPATVQQFFPCPLQLWFCCIHPGVWHCHDIGCRNQSVLQSWKQTICHFIKFHYNDVIMGAMASQITSLAIVYSTVYSDQIKENIKAPRHWPLWWEFTGYRWIPCTKGQ